ncbi:hypothetical protein C943_03047 [Mariniradius saccharolyticus AK6]|uniref:Uncharacterized protein n=1 Tax=Mariniradius saccharolyticus AK6 TaxID=1239962 RepID=M7XJX5_9BACT|nr:hypothetical protein C943_03047 [Mariniradius saccharolyticus AK6]
MIRNRFRNKFCRLLHLKKINHFMTSEQLKDLKARVSALRRYL